MWGVTTERLERGRVRKVAVRRSDDSLRFAEAITLWQQDRVFREFFIGLLAEAPFIAFFWECPAVTESTIGRPFEFVLVDSPPLAAMPPDAGAFAEHFAAGEEGEGIATFWNLGRDALLVAPCPRAPVSVYTHLAAFARAAPAEQQHALWRAVGAAVVGRLGTLPIWISTSGLGVGWLHVRLDSRPKYYSYNPYRIWSHQW
jgi:hypothetical protein